VRADLRAAILSFVALALLAAACASNAGAPEATGTPPPAPASATATARETATAVSPSPPAPRATASPSATATPTPTAGPSVTISAVGDVSLAREVVDRMQTNGADYPFALIAPLVTGDIGYANLEGALTDRGEPWPKGYNFRTPPQFASGLLAGHFGVVSLANNHAMDYGVVGLEDTLAALDAGGIKHAGAGANFAAARAPVIVEANGLRVAFLACVLTPTEGGGFSIYDWQATSSPGLAICDPAMMDADVKAARAQADFVIVAPHAGTEYDNRPNDTQLELASAAMSAGADAYIGAHAHVVQPIEQRGHQLVAWGLGNFIFDLDDVDLANIPEPRVSLILNITLTKGAGVTAWQAVPVTQDAAEDRPRPSTPSEAAVLEALVAGN
jgi:poly-gamma-glutamate synthesis protein (capsule biosynthesis protein)